MKLFREGIQQMAKRGRKKKAATETSAAETVTPPAVKAGNLTNNEIKKHLGSIRKSFGAHLKSEEWTELCDALNTKVRENENAKVNRKRKLSRQDVALAVLLLDKMILQLGNIDHQYDKLTTKERRKLRVTLDPHFGKTLGAAIFHRIGAGMAKLLLDWSPETKMEIMARFARRDDFYLNLPTLLKIFKNETVKKSLGAGLHRLGEEFLKKLNKSKARVAIDDFGSPDDAFLVYAFEHSRLIFLVNLKSKAGQQ